MDKNTLFTNALIFATEKHRGKMRKDGITPYIWHPIEIAMAIKNMGFSIKYQLTALLHDTYEDNETTTIEELKQFGDDVAEAVLLLSNNYNFTTYEEYIDRILHNHLAAVVKNCDRIFNLREAQRLDDFEFLKRYVENSLKYYYGKFSEALNREIGSAESGYKTKTTIKNSVYLSDGYKYFTLFSDIKRARYERAKENYKVLKISEIENVKIYDDEGTYFVASGFDKCWMLTSGGWTFVSGGRYNNVSEYDAERINMDQLKECIKELVKKDFFCDFVETEKLVI